MHDMDVVTAGIPALDGCLAFKRIKAFVTSAGVCSILEHQFRARDGRLVDLSPTHEAVSESGELVTPGVPSTTSDTLNDCPRPAEARDTGDDVVVRFREAVGVGSPDSGLIYLAHGTVENAEKGTVRCRLPVEVASQPGIYLASWGFVREGDLKMTNDAVVCVQRTLFGSASGRREYTQGPPTFAEIRAHLIDSDRAENFLLDDVEFNDDQLAVALVKPVQFFNESLPPIDWSFNTTNFPFQSQWLDAAVGYLLQSAAHNYRRNTNNTRSGGMDRSDKDKEREYLQMAQLLLKEYKDFVLATRIAANARLACGGGI
jgi:hypothetical protein